MNVSIRNNKGFSLVELMVVVAIIGILAAIAIPNFQRFTAKSKQAEVKSNLAMLYSAERAFNSEWQVYNARFKIVGYAPTGTMRYQTGFAGDYIVLPGNYTGPTVAQSPDLSTATYCTQGGTVPSANGCNIVILPVAPGGLPGAAPTAITFLAGGIGDIVGAGNQDTWTMNELKTLINTNNGLP